MSVDYQLYSLFAKEAFVGRLADGHIKLALRRNYFQKAVINVVLSKRHFQILKFGCADETFDFDDDFHTISFGRKRSFGSKISI